MWPGSKMSRFGATAVLVTAVLLGCCLLIHNGLGLSYRISSYSGDGRIADNGFWSYPRYIILFEPVVTSQKSSHVYRIVNPPRVPWTLCLKILTDLPDDRIRELSQDILVKVRLIVDEDKELLVFSDTLDKWVFSWSAIERYYWHSGLRVVDLGSYGKVTLILDIRMVKVTDESLLLQPCLRGGGNELP
jgi:hypothetical protein